MSHPARYRGRIAPSPTGLLHLGHAATFATAARRAFEANGELIFRLDDLDPQRCRTEFGAAALEDLQWLGIRWQEGPDIGGLYGPYRQSERQPLYRAALFALYIGGFIYPCRCSRKDLALLAQDQHEDEAVYPGTCRPALCSPGTGRLTNDEAIFAQEMPSRTAVNWRFRVPVGQSVHFEDGHHGRQRFIAGVDFGDFLIWRREGVPAYQLAVAVDDAAMRITEVVRGADLLKSTARQILLCRALQLPEPTWHHCPLIRDANGEKLAKRHNALSLRELRASGMDPENILENAREYCCGPDVHRGPDL